MPNTMDCIIIRFGEERMTARQRAQKRSLHIKNARETGSSLDFIKALQHKEYRDLPIIDFLKLKPDTLSPDEQKMQKLLDFLYRVNGHEPPLYTDFPNREKALVMDLTTVANEDCLACYLPEEHQIQFNQISGLKNEWKLLTALAHELKHAQQWFDDRGLNNYQQHQIGFLAETQARACSERAIHAIDPQNSYCETYANAVETAQLAQLASGRSVSQQELETLCLKEYLISFFDDKKFEKSYKYYKDRYDKRHPINDSDTPLEKIPPSFGLDKIGEIDIIEDLKYFVPRTARTPENKIWQAIENGDLKTFSEALQKRDSNGNPYLTQDQKSSFMTGIIERGQVTLFEALLSSGPISSNAIHIALDDVFAKLDANYLTPKIVEGRQKIFDILVAQRDSDGNKIIPLFEIQDSVELAQIEADGGNTACQPLVDHAKKYLHNPKTRLEAAQTLSPQKPQPVKKLLQNSLNSCR